MYRKEPLSMQKVLTIIVATIMIMEITACGAGSNETNTVDSQTESSITEKVTGSIPQTDISDSASVSATTEVGEEKEEIVPWYIENNIAFTDEKEFQMPYYSYIRFADSVSDTEYECDQNDAKYSIDSIEIDNSENDYYICTVQYTVTYNWKGVFSNKVVAGDFYPNFQYSVLHPLDKNTGTVYPEVTLESSIDKGLFVSDEIDYTVHWDGKQYDIAYKIAEEGKELFYNYTQYDSQRDVYEDQIASSHTISVKAPKGYDGLIFMLGKNGVTNYAETPESSEAHMYGERKSESIDAYFFDPFAKNDVTDESSSEVTDEELTSFSQENMKIQTVSAWISSIELKNNILSISASKFMDSSTPADTQDLELDRVTIAVTEKTKYAIYYVPTNSTNPVEPQYCTFEELKSELLNNQAANLRIDIENNKARNISISIRE